MGLYPPVYYGVMRAFVGDDFDDSVLRMRVVNSVVAVSMVGLLAFLIPISLRRPLVWAFLASCVPLGLFILGSINPSSWAFLSAGTLWISYYAAFAARGRRRWALVAFSILAMLMGSGARGDACMYSCLAVVVVYILRWGMLRANRGLTMAGAGMVIMSGAFFLTSDQSSVASSGLPASAENLSASSPLALAVDNLLALPHLLTGMFGSWGLGWLDTYMEPLVFQSAFLVFGGLVFLGLSNTTTRKTLAVALIALTLISFPLYVLVQSEQVVGQSVQPRYILPLVVMLIGVSLLSDGPRRGIRLSRPQVFVVVALLGAAQSLALHTNIRRYVTGADVNGLNLNTSTEWWWDVPVNPMTVWIVGSLAFVLFAGLALNTRVLDDVRRVDGPEQSPDEPRTLMPTATGAATAG